MSAEGKKKRGVAGAANAKSIPWRYGQSNACVPAGVPRASKDSAVMLPKGYTYAEATRMEFKGGS